ncbi:MAG: hypothetical protein M0D57_03445 [Sphingobacteriales bacterium JAD_PAG50586_3]|nr:MAG: hypothetical protein M0D57_03445 [Sphingobacteriales bacterium JAD_PAG50586_3]
MKKPFTIKLILSVFTLLLFVVSANAQNTIVVEAKGIGLAKIDATQDAVRNAVSQGLGVAVKSETKVENFMTISDAIATHSEGYVSKYTVVKEGPANGLYQVTISATVSLDPLKADYQLLAKSVGGVRFMAVPNEEKAKTDRATYDFAIDAINSALSAKKYRYVDKTRYENLKKEAMNIKQEGDTGVTYVQNLGIKADAQFIIELADINVSKREGPFGTRTESKTNIVAKAYDNCTGEGLGTVIMESTWGTDGDDGKISTKSIKEAVDLGVDKLLQTFTTYIGDWVNNGTPFELRFYEMGTFRDLRDLRSKLKADATFGGQLELTSVNNYSKLICTYKSLGDDMADKVLDLCDQIPSLVDKRIDVKLIYGRQISFAPQSYVVPNMVKPAAPLTTTDKPVNDTKSTTKPATGGTSTKPANTKPAGTKTGTTTKTTTKPATKTTTPKKAN